MKWRHRLKRWLSRRRALTALAYAAAAHPGQRLGQVIVNARHTNAADLFYLEDEELAATLTRYALREWERPAA